MVGEFDAERAERPEGGYTEHEVEMAVQSDGEIRKVAPAVLR